MAAQWPHVGRNALTSAGSCFGYAVDSELPLDYLRRGPGVPLRVLRTDAVPEEPRTPPLVSWPARHERPFSARLHARPGNGFQFTVEGVARFDVDPGNGVIAVDGAASASTWESVLWGVPAMLCIGVRGDLALHAAAVEVGGSALILAAPGRAGKTTLAAAFARAGHRLLSEDMTCCRPGRPSTVLPGPALVRVRPDVHARFRIEGVRVVTETPDRVHLALADSARGTGLPVPIFAVVLLTEGGDEASLERWGSEEAIRDLWALSFKLPTEADQARCFRAVADLAATVPVWKLRRRLRFEELDQVVDKVLSQCS